MDEKISNLHREYSSIDLMKFVFSICIVGIHTNLLNTTDSFAGWMVSSLLFRTGVPFFFVVSGFFLSEKIYETTKENIIPFLRKYLSRYIPPLIVWGGVGLIFAVYDLIVGGKSVVYIVAYMVRTIFYPLGAMWYLLATIIGSTIVTEIYIHFKKWKLILIIFSLITYAFLLICNNYAFLIQGTFLEPLISGYMRVFVSARNGVFLAPTYLGMGFLLQDYIKNKGVINTQRSIIACFISFLLLSFEVICLYREYSLDDRGFFVFQLLFAPSLVLVCLCINVKLKFPYKLLRRLSTSIYFLHSAVRNVIIHFTSLGDNTLILFLCTLSITVIIALIIYRSNSHRLSLVFG